METNINTATVPNVEHIHTSMVTVNTDAPCVSTILGDPTPVKAPMSTGKKVAIGLGATAVVSAVGAGTILGVLRHRFKKATAGMSEHEKKVYVMKSKIRLCNGNEALLQKLFDLQDEAGKAIYNEAVRELNAEAGGEEYADEAECPLNQYADYDD